MRRIKENLKRNKLIRYTYKVIKGYKNPLIYDYVVHSGALLNNLHIEKIGFGKEIVYSIEIDSFSNGFFALYFRAVCGLAYADFLKIKPYVRYGKTCLYSEKANYLGTDNSFEYYFQPVSEVTELSEEYSIIRFQSNDSKYIQLGVFDLKDNLYKLENEKKSQYIDRLATISEKYIQFNQFTSDLLTRDIKRILDNKKTLGVHARGGEWRKPVLNHPVAVTLEEHIEHVKKTMKEYAFEQIFLATDEIEAITAFKEEFGDKVVYYEDTFRGENGQWLLGMESEREYHNYKLGYEVLRDAETLVYCDGLIAGQSNISIYVEMKQKILKRKLEYFHITNNGVNTTGEISTKIANKSKRRR